MEEKTQYIPPQLEEVAFKNENGFAASGNLPAFTNNTNLGEWLP